MSESKRDRAGPNRSGSSRSESWNWDRYRPWLRLLANQAVPVALQPRCDPSDIVQQTLAEAWRSKEACRGETESQRQAWLRGILGNVLAGQQRFHLGTAARSVDREQRVHDSLVATSLRLQGFIANDASPSEKAQNAEMGLVVADALDRLSDEYREVLWLRHFEDLSHEEIARKMNRSSAAVRMLWVRALAALKKQMPPATES